MTYALVGTPAHNSTATPVTNLSVTYSPTAGNGLVVIVTYQNANAVTISSITNQSGTALPYTQVGALHDNASYGSSSVCWVPNVPAGITAVKVTLGTSSGMGVEVLEYSGLWTTNAVAGSNTSGTITATTAANNLSMAVTPTQQPGMLFSFAMDISSNTSLTAGTGFTSRTNTTYTLPFGSLIGRTEDQRITTTSPVNATWTNTATSGDTFQMYSFVIPEPPSPPVLTSPTPSGTLATSSTAIVGATTTVGSGTGYCVVTTSSLSGVTAAQVKAGQNAAGSTTGVFNSNGAISASGAFTCPQITGLTATTLYNYAVVHNSVGGDSNVVTGTFTTHAPVPTISTISPSPLVDGSSATISGTTFGSTKGTGHADLAGVAQTTTAWADTSITETVSIGANAYGVNVSQTITNNNGDVSSAYTVTINPPSGWAYVNLTTPNATSANRITAVADLASGDQLEYNTQGGLVTVASDATFSADQSVASFDVRAWTPGSGWGSYGTQTLSSAVSTNVTISAWFA